MPGWIVWKTHGIAWRASESTAAHAASPSSLSTRVCGKNDPIFLPAGANAQLADLPQAKIHFFNMGYFALEEDAAGIAQQIPRFNTQ